jgi:hypothetical protein
LKHKSCEVHVGVVHDKKVTVPVPDTKACRGSSGIAPLFHSFGIRQMRVAGLTPRPLYF